MVIDSYRGFKKKSNCDETWAHDMYLNVCVCDKFLAARNGKKMKFWTFKAQPASVKVIHPYFVSKTSFREISMIKMVILDQSKPILLISKIK